MEDPTARGRWMPAAAGWREKVSKRKSFSMWVGGPGGTVCSEMPGADCNDRLCSLVSPPRLFFFPCFPEEQLHGALHLPQISTLPQRAPSSSCQNYSFLTLLLLHGGCQWEQPGEYSRGFSPSNLYKTFQRNKIPFSLAAWEPTASPSAKPPSLCAWSSGKREENPIWELIQAATTSHLVGKTGKNYVGIFKIRTMVFIFPKSLCLLYGLSLCAKNSLREGPKAGIPGKCFTLFLPAPALSLQLSFHHWVQHPEHNQCLKHLKTGLSQPRKRAGFNVCRSTKALSPEHLTYWQSCVKRERFSPGFQLFWFLQGKHLYHNIPHRQGPLLLQ